MSADRLVATGAMAVLLVSVPAGCGGEDYCSLVADRQAELTDITASGSPEALLEALPILRDLAAQAPDDIGDEWATVIDPLEELADALEAADVDPASYDPEALPGDLDEGERERIAAAGAALADPAVARAFDGVQQQAKDVCHTPLTL